MIGLRVRIVSERNGFERYRRAQWRHGRYARGLASGPTVESRWDPMPQAAKELDEDQMHRKVIAAKGETTLIATELAQGSVFHRF